MEELLKSAKLILGTVAPTLASALGGPLAGMAVRGITEVLGLAPDTPEEKVYAEISNASPETLLKLKELDSNFKIQMKKLEIDLVSLGNSDRDSARNREINIKDYTNKILAFIIVALYCSIQLWLVFSGQTFPSEMREIIMRTFGTLDALIGLVFGYYFGSSVDNLISRGKK